MGTAANQILEVTLADRQVAVKMEGHFGDVWGLAPHPTEQVFATTGHDKCVRAAPCRAACCALYVLTHARCARRILRLWDYRTRAPLKVPRANAASSPPFIPPAHARARAQTYEFKSEVRSCAFAPDGNFLAVGSKTGRVSLSASTRLAESALNYRAPRCTS